MGICNSANCRYFYRVSGSAFLAAGILESSITAIGSLIERQSRESKKAR